MNFEEWAAMPEDEPGELVDGRLEAEEVPDLVHELVVSWLGSRAQDLVGPGRLRVRVRSQVCRACGSRSEA